LCRQAGIRFGIRRRVCWLSFPAFNGLACPQGGYRSFPTAFAVRFRSNSISF